MDDIAISNGQKISYDMFNRFLKPNERRVFSDFLGSFTGEIPVPLLRRHNLASWGSDWNGYRCNESGWGVCWQGRRFSWNWKGSMASASVSGVESIHRKSLPSDPPKLWPGRNGGDFLVSKKLEGALLFQYTIFFRLYHRIMSAWASGWHPARISQPDYVLTFCADFDYLLKTNNRNYFTRMQFHTRNIPR